MDENEFFDNPFDQDHMMMDLSMGGGFPSVEIPNFTHKGELKGKFDPKVAYEQALENLQQIFDPEIPINVWDLGLIYGVQIDDTQIGKIQMTLTTPNCPSAQELPMAMQEAINAVPGILGCELTLTFEPPWTPAKISEDGKMIMELEYGIDPDAFG